MVDHLMETPYPDDGEPSPAPESMSTASASPVSFSSNPEDREMSLPVLAAHCLGELDHFRKGEPCTDTYGIELFRRANEGDQEAWAWVQHYFGGAVLSWLRRHPQRTAATRLESEEYYVAQAFERFWQATASKQLGELSTLTAALQYLYASLHGAILDTLRVYARQREIALREPEEAHIEDMTSSSEVWNILKTLLPNARERRLAYLLFHCGLRPREIVHCCPQEWSDVHEVYGLRRTIMERVLRNADLLRLRLS